MKKAVVVLGLTLLLFAFSYPWGAGQVGTQSQEEEVGKEVAVAKMGKPVELQKEIELLTLINLLELTEEQIEGIQKVTADLLASKGEIEKAQVELRNFLLKFQGSAKELEEAIAPLKQKLLEAQNAFEEGMDTALDQIKDILTIKQGEILTNFLTPAFKEKRVEMRREIKIEAPRVTPEEVKPEEGMAGEITEGEAKAEAKAREIPKINIRKFFLDNLEVLNYLLTCKLNPEPCMVKVQGK
ncbi:TPA: hypothetical protein EYP12_01590 [Candidatus Bipolaricaulota bacterium]|nr:hypothetical protein [Candidatus Bipolaricaulota bacterium]